MCSVIYGLKFCRLPLKRMFFILLFLSLCPHLVVAEVFPAVGWHRGRVDVAQENSKQAIEAAFKSGTPNIEVDIIDFIDDEGHRKGLLSHDYKMARLTGKDETFIRHHDINSLPPNSANSDLSPVPFITVVDLFDSIRQVKAAGQIPLVSLDMKEEGDSGQEFGRWVGELIKEYGFEEHVFASSFFKNNVVGVKEACAECQTGGVVYKDHFALQFLDPAYSTLDLTGFSRATFFLGFIGKKRFPHDFVLLQDEVLFSRPELINYWKEKRKVRFVGVFSSGETRDYSEQEWVILRNADWLELDPQQMKQYRASVQ